MTVYNKSRYVPTPAYMTRGVKLLKLRTRKQFNFNNATLYTVIQGDTLDFLAYKIYGSSSYFWAILDANPKYQSEMDIKAGDILVIPAVEDVVGE